jgi:ABC-type uncharacterized transport system permease subunit
MKLLKTAFIFLFWALCLPGLSALQDTQSITTEALNLYERALRTRETAERLILLSGRPKQSQPYRAILTQYGGNLSLPPQTETNSGTATDELSKLLSDQMTDLLSLKQQWATVQTLSQTLLAENGELMSLLTDSGNIIADLQTRLENALERVTDAEEGAIALLDENTQIYDQSKSLIVRT